MTGASAWREAQERARLKAIATEKSKEPRDALRSSGQAGGTRSSGDTTGKGVTKNIRGNSDADAEEQWAKWRDGSTGDDVGNPRADGAGFPVCEIPHGG